MDLYQRQYWSFYMDFIEAFKSLHYKEIPLPLLYHFNFILNQELRKKLAASVLESYLKNKITTESDIQPKFDQYLYSISKKVNFRWFLSEKKVLIYRDIKLRIPSSVYQRYMDTEKTVVLEESPPVTKSKYCGLPVDHIKNFTTNVDSLINKYISKAEHVFSKLNGHPIFSNRQFQLKFISMIPKMIELLVAIDNYYDQVPVSCVIVGYTGTIVPRILVLLAASKGIPSICLQHGLILCKIGGYTPVLATKQAVYGQYEIDWYKKRGVEEDKLEIIGHPRMDEIFLRKPISKNLFLKKLKLNPKLKSILIVTQPNRDIKIWQKFITHLVKKYALNIIIKPHKTEIERRKNKEYNAISNKYKNVKVLNAQVSLYDTLANVDAVINNSSTVGLEAMLFNKPVLTLEMADQLSDSRSAAKQYFNKKLLGNLVHSDSVRLARVLYRLLNDPKVRKYARIHRKRFLSYAYTPKNNKLLLSSERLAQLFSELTGG